MNKSAIQDDTQSYTSAIHKGVNEEIRRQKWISKRDIEILARDNTPIPNKTIDCIEILLLHHLAATDNY